MYVPADSDRMVSGLPAKKTLPDMIVLDCEDGVAYASKAKAREAARRIVGGGELLRCRRTVAVRVNPSQSSLADEDLRCLLDSPQLPEALVLPKVESAEDLAWLEARLRGDGRRRRLPLVAMIESARALLDMRRILAAAADYSAAFALCGVVFGSDDFCSSVGVERTRGGEETRWARCQFAIVARAHGLLAIDKVEIDFKDVEYFREQCRDGRRLGFTGKQIIHPAQLPTCHEEFSPSPERVRWAERLCEQFDLHSAEGTGAFVFEGQMIDMPTVRVAQNILDANSVVREFECPGD